MGKFGWSLPAGTRQLPVEEPEEPVALRCPVCHAQFPSLEPTRSELWEARADGEIVGVGWTHIYRCGCCGMETSEPAPVWAGDEEAAGMKKGAAE